MPQFGSATIAGALSVANGKAAQDFIGSNSPVVQTQMLNGHIGASQGQTVTPSLAYNIAADATPGIKSDATAIKWAVATGTWVLGP